jgi:multiple sugar transport system permease protein
MNTRTKDTLIAWGFLAPALVLLAVFGLFPIGYAFYVSLHQWQIKKGEWLGFQHYVQALGDPGYLGWFVAGMALVWAAVRVRRTLRRRGQGAPGRRLVPPVVLLLSAGFLVRGLHGLLETGDMRLYNGLKYTFFYALGTIPVQLSISMGMAYLLYKSLRAKGFFRVLFFLPYVTPVIASAVVFRTIFSPHPSSLANWILAFLGMEPSGWLYENKSVLGLALQMLGADAYPAWVDTFFPSLALVSIIFYNIWVYIGYDTVILLAGLSAIPRHYYEAAEIDGANPWQGFRHITLPLVSPTLFFLSMVAVIGTFKAFNHIYIMRTPGAQGSVDVLSIAIFDQIFEYHNAGYASALAFVLFAIILVLTLAQNRLLGKRVFYGE